MPTTPEQRNRANARRRQLAADRRAKGIPLRTPEQKARKRERERAANAARKQLGLKSQRTERRVKARAKTPSIRERVAKAALDYQKGGPGGVDLDIRMHAAFGEREYFYRFRKGTFSQI